MLTKHDNRNKDNQNDNDSISPTSLHISHAKPRPHLSSIFENHRTHNHRNNPKQAICATIVTDQMQVNIGRQAIRAGT